MEIILYTIIKTSMSLIVHNKFDIYVDLAGNTYILIRYQRCV